MREQRRRRPASAATGRAAAFTMIELIIVVAIIGVIAAVAVPYLLGRFTRDEKAKEAAAQQAAATEAPAQPKADAPVAPPKPKGIVPSLESGEVAVRIDSRSRIHGLSVYTEVEATVSEARYVFKIARPEEDHLFEFRFPPDTSEARDASLEVETKPGTFEEPEDVSYTGRGISWIGAPGSKGSFATRVSYASKGRDRFVLPIPGRGRIGELKVSVTAAGLGGDWIPPEGLQPKSVTEGRAVWELHNAVTDRDIVVEVPAERSPMGRAVLLCQLTGLAVFLFGAGLWYLSELRKPGSLDAFRWGHFLLLALTYSLFFVVFTVFAFERQEGPWMWLGVAAAISLPLLCLHISRFTTVKFAFLYALPLAAYTYGIAVNGVYGGPFRTYIFMGAGVVAVAFLTVTYRGWAARREAREKDLFAEREKATDENREAAEDARPLLAKLSWLLSAPTWEGDASGASGPAPARAEDAAEWRRVRDGHRVLTGLFEQWESIEKSEKALLAGADDFAFERRRRNAEILRRAREITPLLKKLAEILPPVVEALSKKREEDEKLARERAEKERERVAEERCVACGKAGVGSPYCPHCGTPRPVALKCAKCGSVTRVPVHLMAGSVSPGEGSDGPPAGAIHCVKCGAPHADTPLAIARRYGLARPAEAGQSSA